MWKSVAFMTVALWSLTAFHASAQTQTLEQMVHTRWMGLDGAPQGINTLTTASNGTLWISTLEGVYTFDGNAFTAVDTGATPRPGGGFEYMLFTHQEDLWLAGDSGAPVRIRAGRAEEFGRADCAPVQMMRDPQEGPDGSIWAALNEKHLVKLNANGEWHCMPLPAESPGHLFKLHVDSHGTLWAVIDDRLYREGASDSSFQQTASSVFGWQHLDSKLRRVCVY
jgi:ligand-binding sensor domain-containing protein